MKLRAPNGDIITIPEGMDPREGISQYYAQQNSPEAMQGRLAQGQESAHQKYTEENPLLSRAAAVGAGALNIGQNLANMVGLASDERLAKGEEDRSRLKRDFSGYHTAGEILPTLLPGGAVGRLAKAGKLAKTMGLLPRGAASLTGAMGEGALYGAAIAGPENRVAGALQGALGGGVGNVAGKAVGRIAGGLAPLTAQATALRKTLMGQPGRVRTGKTFIPLALGAAESGRGSLIRKGYSAFVPTSPTAKSVLQQQIGGLADEGYDATLLRAYPPGIREQVIDTLRGTGRLDEAVKVGNAALAKSPTPAANFTKPAREVLTRATANARVAPQGMPGFEQIAKTTSTMYPGSATAAPLRELSDNLAAIFAKGKGGPGVAERAAFYALTAKMGPGAVAGLRLTASPGFQKVLMGDNAAQTAVRNAIEKGQAAGFNRVVGRIAREAGLSNLQQDEIELATEIGNYMEGTE